MTCFSTDKASRCPYSFRTFALFVQWIATMCAKRNGLL